MHDDTPVAYAFAKIDADILTYATVGYHPDFRRFSPGTVLLLLIIERLFTTQEFRLFDFGGTAWNYKSFFATGSIDYLKVIWFPISVKNVVLVLSHYILLQAWRGAARLRQAGRALRPFGWRGL